MKAVHIALPDNEQKLLVFYLAMEEYIAKNLDKILQPGENGSREAFFIWQVPPTVIFGRNQVMEAEVNLAYCKEHSINLFRRKSGGGCVYSDRGNIMLSYITDSTDVASTFDVFLQEVADMLRALGLDAERSGRNDVMIGGKKVSGNSFFLLPHSGIVHGTLLYDSDFDELEKAITPSSAKISSKGVSSVRQHVTNVREELAPGQFTDIEVFKRYIIGHFCGNDGNIAELVLSREDVQAIEAIEATYLDPDFLKGKNHAYSLEYSGRIGQVGEVRLELKMDSGQIGSCWLRGDIFPLKDNVDEVLTARLKGKPCERASVSKALEGLVLEDYIMNLHTADLVRLIFGD